MRFKNKLFPWLLIAAMLLATGITAFASARSNAAKLAAKDSQRAASLEATVQGIASKTTSRARDLALALQDTSGQAQRLEFARLQTLSSSDQGVSSIGLALKVPERDVAAFEKRHHYRIRTVAGRPLTSRRTHFVVDQLFGSSAEHSAVGVDLVSDPGRAIAIEQAITSALPASTKPMRLITGGTGSVLFVPIFKPGASILTFEGRRTAVVGVIGIGIRNTLMNAAIADLVPPNTPFLLSDEGEKIAGVGRVSSGTKPRYVDFAGRQWAITAQRSTSDQVPSWLLALIGGLVLTGTVALVMVQSSRRERYANGLVAERTVELELASARVAEDARFFELTTDFVCAMDLSGNIVSFNDTWIDALGWSREELNNSTIVNLVHPDDLSILVGKIEALSHGKTIVGQPLRTLAKDGTWHWLEWSAVGAPEHGMIYGSARDITDRVALEGALASERAQMNDAQIIARLGSWSVDTRTGSMYWSDQVFQLVGMQPPDEPLTAAHWLSILADEDKEAAQAQLAETLLHGGEFEFAFRRKAPGMRGEDVHLLTRGFAERDDRGDVTRVVGTVVDVTDRLRHEAHLQHMANHDPLTGLANRRQFDIALQQHLSRCMRYEVDGALMALDLDGLKEINDNVGHAAGDESIKCVADTLRDRLRAVDLSARIGGDEFVVLLPRTTRSGAMAVAQSIISALAKPSAKLLELGVTGLSASIGVVMIEDSPQLNDEELMKIADATMYGVKRTGLGGAQMYDPSKPGTVTKLKGHRAA
jgi:diguanylate cyclase (GGDEF)-like protein/PAS domain S-box-containing protein